MAISINSVNLTGRLVRDPEIRVDNKSQKTCARITLALDRGRDSSGNDLGADFPLVVFWGGIADNIEKNLKKGMLVSVTGRIRTGSYVNRDGAKIYFTEISGTNIVYLNPRDTSGSYEDAPSAAAVTGQTHMSQTQMDGIEGFSLLGEDDMPF